jgi:hypothetical protein
MPPSLAKIEAEALQLSAEENVRLADHLRASVSGDPDIRCVASRTASSTTCAPQKYVSLRSRTNGADPASGEGAREPQAPAVEQGNPHGHGACLVLVDTSLCIDPPPSSP